MVNETAQDIMAEFQALIAKKQPKTEEPARAPLSLAERLRNKIQENKIVEKISDPDFMENLRYFTKTISESAIRPVKHYQKILGGDGIEREIICNIRNKKCEIIHELLPQPFFVVTDDCDQELKGTVYTVMEFLALYKIADKFGGTIKIQ